MINVCIILFIIGLKTEKSANLGKINMQAYATWLSSSTCNVVSLELTPLQAARGSQNIWICSVYLICFIWIACACVIPEVWLRTLSKNSYAESKVYLLRYVINPGSQYYCLITRERESSPASMLCICFLLENILDFNFFLLILH